MTKNLIRVLYFHEAGGSTPTEHNNSLSLSSTDVDLAMLKLETHTSSIKDIKRRKEVEVFKGYIDNYKTGNDTKLNAILSLLDSSVILNTQDKVILQDALRQKEIGIFKGYIENHKIGNEKNLASIISLLDSSVILKEKDKIDLMKQLVIKSKK